MNDEQQIRALVATWMSATRAGDVAPPGGPTTRRPGNTLTVLRKQGGQWQLARDANLLTPVKL